MKIVKIWNDEPTDRQIDQIVNYLEAGEIMIYPTDTLYAIGCDALNVKAIDRICKLKHINPEKTNLSIVCGDISQASEYARFDNYAYKLMRDNTPGEFTFLFKAASTLPRAFRGRKTVGVRIPRCSTARKIVDRLGHPLLTTSIEFEDDDFAVNPDLIIENYYEKVDLMIDAGRGNNELSTIIDCMGDAPIILREGKGKLK